MKIASYALGFGLLASLGAQASHEPTCCKRPVPAPASHACQPLVQIGLLLDTSGSMEGLIEQAKAQLWKIVNQFIKARRDGHTPQVQVALYEYGKSSIPASEGYLRMIVPLTTDLDRVSEALFSLSTNGGEEYCGRVIQAAISGLNWSNSPKDLKAIFIAGNEPFTQGDVDYRAACQWAISKGITVNTIHCGDETVGSQTGWKDGASLGDGSFLNINHNAIAMHIDAPQDKDIADLSVKINVTYVPYGAQGKQSYERQAAQDSNAAGVSAESMAQRAMCKSSANYSNAGWDLIDAVKNGTCKLEEVKDDQLPEEMRKQTLAQRRAFLDGKMQERERIQKEIQRLSEERARFLAEEMKKLATPTESTLDTAVIKAVRDQAQKKGYKFD